MFGKIIKIFYQYEDDTLHGRPVWQDRGFLGLIVGLIASILVKYLNVDLSADLQAAMVTVIAGAFHLSQSHVGFKKAPVPVATKPAEPAKPDEEHNLTGLY